MVQLGFKRAGLPWDPEVVARRFAKMEAYYLGNGWYSDGPGRPKDYYISMAFHYYGLIYATLMAEDDDARCRDAARAGRTLCRGFHLYVRGRRRGGTFRPRPDLPLRRSGILERRRLCRLENAYAGQMKGLIMRHLRYWLAQPIFDRDGILTIVYHYPNLVMAEDYNSPGSPYWAFKLFLVLALPASHAFWQAPEAPLPALARQRTVPEAGHILLHDAGYRHVSMLTAGQLELNNYVNTEAKYTKFAYSSHFGFTVERGRYGLQHAACDSMLLLAAEDGYYRGRRDCSDVSVSAKGIFAAGRPGRTWRLPVGLIPLGPWQVRVHHLRTDRALDSAEGGFALRSNAAARRAGAAAASTPITVSASSRISARVRRADRITSLHRPTAASCLPIAP